MAYEDVQIAPSILSADFARLGEQVQQVAAAGATLLHIDVMDGHFVPNLTMGPLVVESLRPITDLRLDVHLMIDNPGDFIETFADAGADMISIHLESGPNVYRNIQLIKQAGCQAGIAINPHTPAGALQDILTMLDFINVMTVNPGFGGQAFIYEMMPKIARLRAMIGDVKQTISIEVDGGVDTESASSAVQAGADILIAGSSIFRHPDGIAAGIATLYEALSQE